MSVHPNRWCGRPQKTRLGCHCQKQKETTYPRAKARGYASHPHQQRLQQEQFHEKRRPRHKQPTNQSQLQEYAPRGSIHSPSFSISGGGAASTNSGLNRKNIASGSRVAVLLKMRTATLNSEAFLANEMLVDTYVTGGAPASATASSGNVMTAWNTAVPVLESLLTP